MQVAMLIIATIAAVAAVVNAIVALYRIWKESIDGKKKPKVVMRMPKIWIPFLFALIVFPVAVLWLRIQLSPQPPAPPLPPPTIYDFESDI